MRLELGLITCLFFCGCGSKSSTAVGTVTYAGQPVSRGTITFTPAGKGPIVGGEVKNGHYRVTGLTPGKTLVSIAAVATVPFARSSEVMAKMAQAQRLKGNDSGLIDPADIIPFNADGNNVEVHITEGEKVLDFALEVPSPK